MTCFKPALAGLLLLASAATTTQAQSIEGLSVSPDGKTVLMSGTNRVVYTVSADTMEVTGRRYVPQMVRQIFHSDDGALVYFRDNDKRLIAYNTADMSEAWRTKDADEVVYAPEHGTIAILDEHYKDDSIRLVAADNGDQKARVAMGKLRSDMFALGPDGRTALILTQSAKSDAEVKQDEPADMTKLQKADFKQRTDGYVSQVITVDFDLGEFTQAESHYRVSFPHAVNMVDGKLQILRGNLDSAVVGPDGSAELIDLGKDHFNSALLDKAGTTYILTRGTDLRFVPVGGGAAEGLLSVARMQGGPGEWVTAITEGKDGTLYFATNAYRLIKVPADRGSAKVINVF